MVYTIILGITLGLLLFVTGQYLELLSKHSEVRKQLNDMLKIEASKPQPILDDYWNAKKEILKEMRKP